MAPAIADCTARGLCSRGTELPAVIRRIPLKGLKVRLEKTLPEGVEGLLRDPSCVRPSRPRAQRPTTGR